MKNILIYGIGSYKNKGCEAIVSSTLNQLNELDYNIRIASYDFNYNKKFYNDLVMEYVNHYKKENELTEEEIKLNEYYKTIPFDYNNFETLYQNDVIKAMEKSDICLSAGGDNYCYGYSRWLYALTTKAKELGKYSVLWGASLFEKIDDMELVENLKKFDILLVRESLSYNGLKEYIDEEKLLLAPDPAFSLEPQKIKLNDWYNDREVIGLNLSPLTINTSEKFNEIIKFIDYILGNTNYSISLISHVIVDECCDTDILNKIYEKYSNEKRVYLEKSNYNCSEIKYVIGKCKYFIAARTHASIAAYSSIVPTLVIGYSVKSKGIAKDIFGDYKNYVISQNELSFDILKQKFEIIVKNEDKIKKILKHKMPKFKKQAKNLMKLVIDRLNENNIKKVCDKDKCSGCMACFNTCPNNAIKIAEDSHGFKVPIINTKKCTSCNLCRKICPVINKREQKYKQICYAAKNKTKEVQIASSSGGVFSVLADSILNDHGIVYGVTIQNSNVKHIRIDNKNDLKLIRGSKYVQSSVKDIYKKIKDDLLSNKKVLFSGTPCQISGLKAFLKKDYKKLICVSVICHGVISQRLFDKYLNEINFDKKNDKFNFKDKRDGWSVSKVSYDINHIFTITEFEKDPLMWLYVNNYVLRDSCFQCSFKGVNNISDVIIGDYWGVKKYHDEFFDENGVSCLIINSEKGEEFINKTNSLLKVDKVKTNYENIVAGNVMLVSSASKPYDINKIYKLLEENTLNLIYSNYKMKKELDNCLISMKKIETIASDNLRKDEQIQKLSNELDGVYNSRRWKISSKIIKAIKINRR